LQQDYFAATIRLKLRSYICISGHHTKRIIKSYNDSMNEGDKLVVAGLRERITLWLDVFQCDPETMRGDPGERGIVNGSMS
jgi:hypothetical protein